MAVLRLVSACALSVAPAGCAADPPSIVELTGALPPQETAEAQDARGRAMFERIDSYLVSTMYGEIDSPRRPTIVSHSSCSGTSCTLREPKSGSTLEFDREYLRVADDAPEAGGLTEEDVRVGRKHV